MGKIEITQSPQKQGKLLLAGIMMTAISIMLLLLSRNFVSHLRLLPFLSQNGNWIFLKTVGAFCTLFFGAILVFIIKRYKKPKVILTITSEGFTDNSTAISAGFIPWEKVSHIYRKDLLGQEFLCVDLI